MSDISRDISLSKVKPSLGGDKKRKRKKGNQRREGTSEHSFPAFQFQRSYKGSVYIPQWCPRMTVRAALEMCKSNSLTQQFIRCMLANARTHACTCGGERRPRRVFTDICDGMMFMSFLPPPSFFHSVISRSYSSTPEFRSYRTSYVMRQVLNKFFKLSPLPKKKPSLDGNDHTGVMPARASMHPSHVTFPPPRSSFLAVARDARGNLLLRTASSARKERSLRGDVKYARDSTIIKGQKYLPLVLFSVGSCEASWPFRFYTSSLSVAHLFHGIERSLLNQIKL